MSTPGLNGLLLAGGRSTRMQRDKATLEYDGRPQLERAMALLAPLVGRAFVSVRPDQLQDRPRAAYPCIADLEPGLGPIAGIHAALATYPDSAWLVIACDLPYLGATTIESLIAQRDPRRIATAFRSSTDRQPEPLCAIYEPAALGAIEGWIAAGQRCPRAFLAQADVLLLDAADPHALDNVNTPADYAAASGTRAARRHLRIRYFALLREQAGRSSEELDTPAGTPQELYAEISARHGLTIGAQFLRVAINDEFADWRAPLADGDTVVFLPPVAGG
jgi:molybdopterin-guanine dinucleotide biosynthesis protein A